MWMHVFSREREKLDFNRYGPLLECLGGVGHQDARPFLHSGCVSCREVTGATLCFLVFPKVRLSGEPALDGLDRRKSVSSLTCVRPGSPCLGVWLSAGSPPK